MNDILSQLFGAQAPSYAASLLGDQMPTLNSQANKQGQMMAALSLLAASGPSPTKQSLGQILAQGMMAGQKAARDEYDRGIKDRMTGMQVAQMQRDTAEQEAVRRLAPNLFTNRVVTPAQNTFYGAPTMAATRDDEGNLMPGAAELPAVTAPALDMNMLQQLLVAAPKSAAPVLASLKSYKDFATPKTAVLAEGGALVNEETGQVLAQGGAKEDSFVRLLRQAGIDPASPQGRQLISQRLQKEATHQSPVSVSYGAPVAGVDDSGKPVFFQPSKDGAAPSIIPGVRPVKDGSKLPAELQRMQIAADSMEKLLGDYEMLLQKNNPRDAATMMNPQARAEINAIKTNLALQFKELQALGALTGPDVAMMERALSDPFSPAGLYYGPDGLKSQIRQARNLIKVRRESVQKSQGDPNAPSNADPLGLRR